MSRTSSERLIYVKFTSCVYGDYTKYTNSLLQHIVQLLSSSSFFCGALPMTIKSLNDKNDKIFEFYLKKMKAKNQILDNTRPFCVHRGLSY